MYLFGIFVLKTPGFPSKKNLGHSKTSARSWSIHVYDTTLEAVHLT